APVIAFFFSSRRRDTRFSRDWSSDVCSSDLDLGLHGIAMSRFSGCWVAFKCVTDVIESGAVVEIDPQRVSIVMPPDFAMPPGGLNIRWPDAFLVQDARLVDYTVCSAIAYCAANRLDRIVWDN